tara:strand:- start:26 stop:424 length:399 start_codon:yes stop_codon:yes gene_type:complete
MPSLKHYVKGGVTISSGSVLQCSVNNQGVRSGLTGADVFTFSNGLVVTSTSGGSYVEFSGSSFDRVANGINSVTGETPSFPTSLNEPNLFNGGYETRAFFGKASDSDNADFKGNGYGFNEPTSSINDGITGN